MRIERISGAILILLSGVLLLMAAYGGTPEDRDATAILLTLPMGLVALFTEIPERGKRETTGRKARNINKLKGAANMARKRVVEAPSLHSWEDVNDALRQIAEAQIALGEIQSDMQKQILGAQKVAEEQSKPLNDNVAKLEREIKSFVTDHRDEMGKTKSMVLTFGEVGFRLSTSVSLPRAKEKLEEIIRRLKSRQMTDCIVVEEKVSKEALKKYGEDTVNAVGATWKQSDVFGYEVNIAKLEQIKAGN